MNGNSWDENLEKEENAEPFWERILPKAFPGCTWETTEKGKTTQQLAGVDKIIHISGSEDILIDTKIRDDAWNDILLEVVSNTRTKDPGCIQRDLPLDYMLYGMKPTQTAYLIPWKPLKEAWEKYGFGWIKSYSLIVAENRRKGNVFYSVSCPVSVEELQRVLLPGEPRIIVLTGAEALPQVNIQEKLSDRYKELYGK